MTVPTAGDVLMLSQVAWKIGRAFSAGRTNAPSEFQFVEAEIGSLAKSLKHLAEVLHADTEESLIQICNKGIQQGIATIISSCRRSVSDLDSLVDQYQVIRKHRTVGGFAIERSWSDLVLTEYETLTWTTEGGSLQNLGDVLQMHTSTVTLLTQALQSKSVSRIENVVHPMADRIDSMYITSQSLDDHFEALQSLLRDLVIHNEAPPVPQRNPARSPVLDASIPDEIGSRPSSPPPCQNATMPLPQTTQGSQSSGRPSSSRQGIDTATPLSSPENMSSSGMSSMTQKRVPEFSFSGSSLRYSSSSYASSDAGNSSVGWPSPGLPRDSYVTRATTNTTTRVSTLPHSPEMFESSQKSNIRYTNLLPPPALEITAPHALGQGPSHSSGAKLSPFPASQREITKLHRSSTTASQKTTFEKEAFRNGAVLCDLRANIVEYSRQINEDDPRDVEMVQASNECRIAVVRKRVTDPESRQVRVVTSVWAFSDDGATRVELRMDDTQMYIPYASYFSPCKVSITLPCELKFHDIKHGNRPLRVAKTTWVNYVFNSSQGAALFQNELMGRTLLATFRTEKTMRIHDGFGATFVYAEQMCALENLRVWEDNDTGAIIALIHFSASFRAGYLAFYLNSSVNPIKTKDHGGKEVKIKGLRVPIDRGDRAMRKDSFVAGEEGVGRGKAREGKEEKRKTGEKVIGAAKIEFASEEEKREFLELCKEVQKNLVELPDLMGVN